MDGYSFLRAITAVFERRIGMLYGVVAVTAIFSPFILNDVVVIILTPVIVRYAKQFKIDVAPLLVAEITFANIASSLTPLGNPQNILLWTASGISFTGFILGTWLPLLISGLMAVLLLLPFKKRVGSAREYPASIPSKNPGIYLSMVAAVLVLGDLVGQSPSVTLGAGFLLGFLFTFRYPSGIRREFDLRSLLTLYLFIASITIVSILIGPTIAPYALPVNMGLQPYSGLFMGVVSNVISNVPATQLVLSVSSISRQVAPKVAVEAGLAGNIDPIASFANLLALLMARRAGLSIRRTVILQFVIGVICFAVALL
jgi:Na+/H+ antiporter NhaD/arsenite permease-like protein